MQLNERWESEYMIVLNGDKLVATVAVPSELTLATMKSNKSKN